MFKFNIKNVPVSIKTQINNGTLKTTNAMPQKDSTSDNQSSFSMGRKAYNNSFTNNPTINTLKPGHYGIGGLLNGSRRNPTVFDGTSAPNQKKWGNNRDASEIIRKNRVTSVGLGSENTAGNSMSFESHANANTVNHALQRVRGGGAVAPPKKAHNTHNAYSPAPKSIPFNRPQKIVNGVKMPQAKHNFGF